MFRSIENDLGLYLQNLGRIGKLKLHHLIF
jgi:hypothetical protein